eukprot:scpid104984/ scgid22581/ 
MPGACPATPDLVQHSNGQWLTSLTGRSHLSQQIHQYRLRSSLTRRSTPFSTWMTASQPTDSPVKDPLFTEKQIDMFKPDQEHMDPFLESGSERELTQLE